MSRSANGRILLQAEPFGYGPAAAISKIFQELRPAVEWIGYCGSGHTLDLQSDLKYDEIVDLDAVEAFDRVVKGYDLILTAMDFGFAGKCIRSGVRVAVYDALAWYWPSRPAVLDDVSGYFAQDFMGVRERLDEWGVDCARLVAPLISTSRGTSVGRSGTYMSLGGLANPFWADDLTQLYASGVISVINSIPDCADILIAANHSVRRASRGRATTLGASESEAKFASSSKVITTPGLGNIYEIAASGADCLFLPPANDSQGRQLRLLQQNGLCDGLIDWHHILDIEPVDYWSDQRRVLEQLKHLVSEFAASDDAKSRLAACVRRFMELPRGSARVDQLIEMFGSGGAVQVASGVIDLL